MNTYKFDLFLRNHLRNWLQGILGPDANFESYIVLIEEWLGKQDDQTYWLNQGWNRIWDEFMKDLKSQ